jgi:hypothetical protein
MVCELVRVPVPLIPVEAPVVVPLQRPKSDWLRRSQRHIACRQDWWLTIRETLNNSTL